MVEIQQPSVPLLLPVGEGSGVVEGVRLGASAARSPDMQALAAASALAWAPWLWVAGVRHGGVRAPDTHGQLDGVQPVAGSTAPGSGVEAHGRGGSRGGCGSWRAV